MVIVYLILAHLTADFLLQPASLIVWKNKSWAGVVVHAFIHFLLYLLFFASHLTNFKIIGVLAALAFTHFLIDITKIYQEKMVKSVYFISFFVDQLTHLLTIVVANYFLAHMSLGIDKYAFYDHWIFGNFYLLFGLCLFMLVTYTAEVAFYQVRKDQDPKAIFKFDYLKMFSRGTVFILFYLFFLAVFVK